jgi:periplasmic copper chaperone A
MKKYQYLILSIFGLLVLSLVACQANLTPEISVEGVWGRPSPKVATAGAVYMVIKNDGGAADKLLFASSESCGTVELHESYDKGDGVMGMREVPGGFIEIPAKGEAELKMGGLHIMCIDKLDDFEKGAILSLSLEFETSGTKTVDVEIKPPDM